MNGDDDFFGRDVDAVDGTAGHHSLSPVDLIMAAEDADDDAAAAVEWSVGEVFRRILCFVFFDGRCTDVLGWDYAAAAVEVLYREFAPAWLMGMEDDGTSRRRGVGLVSGAGRGVHEMVRELPSEMVGAVLVRMGKGLEGRLWLMELTRRFYALAKMLDEGLIDHASLERLGDIFGEENRKAARSRWSARVHQTLRDVGGSAALALHGRYMKNDEARSRMAEAQRGNTNRKKHQKTMKEINVLPEPEDERRFVPTRNEVTDYAND